MVFFEYASSSCGKNEKLLLESFNDRLCKLKIGMSEHYFVHLSIYVINNIDLLYNHLG